MAWNEPGGGNNGNKDKDPWGGGGGGKNNQGPPDLDEAFKKLQEKLNGIFGGGPSGKGGSASPGPQISGGLVGLLVLVLVAVWGFSGLYQVDAQEKAVVLRLGKFHEIVGEGLHWNPKMIDDVYIENVTGERQHDTRGSMLTEDENIVELPLTVQYNVKDVKSFVLNVRNPEISLEHATDSALRHVVGGSKLDEVISSGREQVGDEVKQRLQELLDVYGAGIGVVVINIQEARPPAQVQSAYDDVVKAREDQERYINEAQAYANGIIPEARGNAQRIVEEAIGYRDKVMVEAEGQAQRFDKLLVEYKKAPEVTRERMYLDAMENVMANTSKVFVDVEGGNNMLYLPLDKMIEQRSAAPQAGGAGMSSQNINEIADEVLRKLRREQPASSRRREVR